MGGYIMGQINDNEFFKCLSDAIAKLDKKDEEAKNSRRSSSAVATIETVPIFVSQRKWNEIH